jgi:putative Holliday junction resolvase
MAVGYRVLGIDFGARRIGLAISDRTRTLARPLLTLTLVESDDPVARVTGEVDRLAAEEDGLSAIVVGLPSRLDGTPTEQTRRVLAARVTVPIVPVDERLTSRDAEALLAVSHRSWRERKAKLDAAAAAVILQEHLDRTA